MRVGRRICARLVLLLTTVTEQEGSGCRKKKDRVLNVNGMFEDHEDGG